MLAEIRTSYASRVCALTVAIATFMCAGCATPSAVLNFTAPSTATEGSPFTVTVTATINGQPDTLINSYIIFASSDPAAVLPPEYGFTPADAGSHTWANGFTLKTPGAQTISATIYDAAGINGSAKITVSPDHPLQLQAEKEQSLLDCCDSARPESQE